MTNPIGLAPILENYPLVHIVDDDAALTDSLRFLFDSVNLPVRVWNRGDAFLRDTRPDAHGVLILDVRIPELSGPDLLDELRRRGYTIPVIVITAYGEVSVAVRTLQAGAVHFLEKPVSHQRLLDEVYRALALDRERKRQEREHKVIRERFARLTDREKEVYRDLVRGNSNKSVAAGLKISPKTVETHRRQVMLKMAADSFAELVRFAVALNVLEGEAALPR